MPDQAPLDPSVDPDEVARFQQFAATWWDKEGPFWPAHCLQDFRAKWLRAWLASQLSLTGDQPLAGWRVLDLGCGGGLMSEAVAQMGAELVAVDATERNIQVAKHHAKQSGLSIDYRHGFASSLLAEQQQFDLVLNLEVVEHVADVQRFMQESCGLVKPGGYMLVATINRTWVAYFSAILMGEYVLKLLPKGTHQYHKLVKPAEVLAVWQQQRFSVLTQTGVRFNPFSRKLAEQRYMGINYFLMGQRAAADPNSPS